MPRIHPLKLDQADKSTAATLAAVKGKLGMVPNLFATFARAPAVLDAYLAFGEALGKGRLNAQQREIVALAVAQANACQYCLSAHTALGKMAGLSESALLDARRGTSVHPLDNAIAGLANKIVRQRGVLADTDLAAARKAGVDDGLIVEVIAHVAVNVLTNYTNHIAGTDVDFPVVKTELAAAA